MAGRPHLRRFTAPGGSGRGLPVRDERGMRRSRRSFAPSPASKEADLQDFYGSDGTRTATSGVTGQTGPSWLPGERRGFPGGAMELALVDVGQGNKLKHLRGGISGSSPTSRAGPQTDEEPVDIRPSLSFVRERWAPRPRSRSRSRADPGRPSRADRSRTRGRGRAAGGGRAGPSRPGSRPSS